MMPTVYRFHTRRRKWYNAEGEYHKQRTHPITAGVVMAVALTLAGFVRRDYGAQDVVLSSAVCWLLLEFWRLL